MKKQAWLTVSYILAMGYVSLGYFFYDWSFKMVPYAGKKFDPNMILDLFSESFLVLVGVSILLSSVFIAKQKPYATKFHLVVFCFDFFILILGSLITSYLVFRNDFLENFAGVIGLLLIMYAPAIIFFFISRKIVLDQRHWPL